MGAKNFKPGQPAPRSGQYQEVGPRGGTSGHREITSTEGKPLPPTTKPGSSYRLADRTNNSTARR